MSTRGQSLELFFVNGNPEGMQTAEVFNWTGHVLYTPRTSLAEALKRKEAKYTGVYILLGKSDEDIPLAYIGESENVAQRITSHAQTKDWWTSAVLITTGADTLNKAHARYLEHALLKIDKNELWELQNTLYPPKPSLSESAKCNMDTFLSYILLVLPAIRVDLFQTKIKTDAVLEKLQKEALVSSEVKLSPVFELVLEKYGIHARAQVVDSDFVVFKNSTVRSAWNGAELRPYKKLYDTLRKDETIIEDKGRHIFAKNYTFASPSAAAAIVTGRSANGRVEWKVEGMKMTYNDWENKSVSLEQ